MFGKSLTMMSIAFGIDLPIAHYPRKIIIREECYKCISQQYLA
jgi:hypothetical protein